MGWSTEQVDRSSLWKFIAAWRGWKRANCMPEGPSAPSASDHEAAMAFAVSQRTLH